MPDDVKILGAGVICAVHHGGDWKRDRNPKLASGTLRCSTFSGHFGVYFEIETVRKERKHWLP